MTAPRRMCFALFLAAMGLASPGVPSALALELLPDIGFEDPNEFGQMGSLWSYAVNEPPMPTVNATSDPRSGAEHARLELDTSQLFTAFGPAIRSIAFAGSGPSAGITDYTGMTLTLTNHYKVSAFNMRSPDAATAPAVLVRTYLAYISSTFGFLGFGGFEGNFPTDEYPEGVNADYQATSFSLVVPNFGTPVTSVEFSFGLVAPDTAMGQMTGTATVLFDDVSLTTDLPPTSDYNENGFVDAADYVVWRDTLGQTGLGPFALGDGNGDGAVTAADYDIWKSEFGLAIGTGSAVLAAPNAVPEPGSSLVLLSWIVLYVWRGNRRPYVHQLGSALKLNIQGQEFKSSRTLGVTSSYTNGRPFLMNA